MTNLLAPSGFAEAFVEGAHDRVENVGDDRAPAGLDLGSRDETRAEANVPAGEIADRILELHARFEDGGGVLIVGLERNRIGADLLKRTAERAELLEREGL